jgi:hypothetical protein
MTYLLGQSATPSPASVAQPEGSPSSLLTLNSYARMVGVSRCGSV